MSKDDIKPRKSKKSFNWQPIKTTLQKYIGLICLTALAIDGVRMRADDEKYMLVVGIGFALLCLYLAFEGSRK